MIDLYRGSEFLNFSPDAMEIPFFVGNSNREAFEAAERILDGSLKALFVYGDRCTGKTHLLHTTGYKAWQKNLKVYVAHARKFQEVINEGIISHVSSFDLVIIDDLHKFNNPKAYPIISEILTLRMQNNKPVIFSFDVPAHSWIDENFLSAGLFCELRLPDKEVKIQYLDHRCQKYNIFLPPTIKEYIIKNSVNFYDMEIMLLQDIELYRNIMFTSPKFIYSINFPTYYLISKVYNFIADYYYLNLETQTKTSRRRTRLQTIVDGLTYYILYNSVDVRALRRRLNIPSNLHKYYFEKGEKIYNSLPDSIKNKIEELKQLRK